ncbi:HEPN domain-containing protein [Sulfolobus sp. S-194]|uniref:HEPN domain-containing protein n=1 Tax=Sulfolobus sp. S-194 TaxID=2512240 RepID=UPI001436F4AE|nr:HEPN domain-containing protein [Sulfolobus sp. S-194]QIW24458.1 HEPN domain-containing protein [Sulfolobus sp. S-194]
MTELIEKGKQSFHLAEDALAKGYYWLSCFLFHQSVELSLKGILEATKNTHPFSHNLTELIKELGLPVPPDILQACVNLNPHYISARYAMFSYYQREDAENCKKNAEVILKWLKIF